MAAGAGSTKIENIRIITYQPILPNSERIDENGWVGEVIKDRDQVIYKTRTRSGIRKAYLECICWLLGFHIEELLEQPDTCSGIISNEILENLQTQGAWLLPKNIQANGEGIWNHIPPE